MLILKRIAMIVFGGSVAFITIALAVLAIKERIARKKKEPWYKEFLE